jgi:adenosylcobyric acid synthase
VDCPVILIADIDRGGVFAHLVGTLELLSETEQQRVIGFVINRFRGDIALLQPGLDWLEKRTGKPVLGVIPYLPGLQLDAEDAVDVSQVIADQSAVINVVVPVFPRISNHTDFDALRLHPQVNLCYVGPDQAIPPADLIILPGSKSVPRDLQWLHQQGWVEGIQKHLRYGGRLLGICGGYQMLGHSVNDPLGVEGDAGLFLGLGLLDIDTVLTGHKQLRRVEGVLNLGEQTANSVIQGYEIHCGETSGVGLEHPMVTLSGGRVDGAISPDGQVMGTYLHGLFDHPESCSALLQWAGLSAPEDLDISTIREQQLDRLAATLDQHLDFSGLDFPMPLFRESVSQ